VSSREIEQIYSQWRDVLENRHIIAAIRNIDALAAVVESHKRRTWLFAPLKSIPRGVVNAALWIATAGALATVHAWVHAAVPIIP